MSIQAMSWAMSIELDELNDPAARHVLITLANYAGEDGRAAFRQRKPFASILVWQSVPSVTSSIC